MPRPFKWEKYFRKDAALLNRSNKYEVTCLKCQKKIPKGRSEDRTRHLLDECPELTREEHAAVVEVAAKDTEAADAAAQGRSTTGNKIKRPRIPWVKSEFTDGEITEILRLVTVHHPVDSEDDWAAVANEYNIWAQANGYKRHAVDSLKKQWGSRVQNASGISHYHYSQPTERFAWDEDAIPVTSSLGNVRDGGAEPEASYDPSLIGSATAGPSSYTPPQTHPTNRPDEISPTSPHALQPDKRPVRRSLTLNPRRTSENVSLVKVLERENEEKSKRIERLEGKIEKLEDKVEKLDARNRTLESQNQLFQLQLVVARDPGAAARGGSGSTAGEKRKRASSADIALISQLQEASGGGGEARGDKETYCV